jgi:predicted HicB family RNase H-like nuclease
MAQGQISENNTRINIVIPKELKDRADIAANKDGRSLASWIRKLISDALNEQDK